MKKIISQFEVISRHDLEQISGGGNQQASRACEVFCGGDPRDCGGFGCRCDTGICIDIG